MKKSQLEWIKDRLIVYGEISRNQCLKRYISRLSGRILDLRRMGFEFETERRKGDYFYKLIQKPN